MAWPPRDARPDSAGPGEGLTADGAVNPNAQKNKPKSAKNEPH